MAYDDLTVEEKQLLYEIGQLGENSPQHHARKAGLAKAVLGCLRSRGLSN
jgi:hypothetical protein